jgi:hypothetical protein
VIFYLKYDIQTLCGVEVGLKLYDQKKQSLSDDEPILIRQMSIVKQTSDSLIKYKSQDSKSFILRILYKHLGESKTQK